MRIRQRRRLRGRLGVGVVMMRRRRRGVRGRVHGVTMHRVLVLILHLDFLSGLLHLCPPDSWRRRTATLAVEQPWWG
jgi:hypothetical protein